MTSKAIRKTIAHMTDIGPTPQALTHGALEIKPLQRGDKRGTIMARRVGMHERLYARGKLNDAEWSWVCRYVRETEIAAGARLGRPEGEPAESWSGPMIYNRQCAAIGFLRRSHARITAQQRGLLIAACVECALVADLGPLIGVVRRAAELDDGYSRRAYTRVEDACVRAIKAAAGRREK